MIRQTSQVERTTSGFPMSATATERRRFIPPEKAPALWFADSVSRTSSIRLFASAMMESALMPLIVPKRTKCSRAERLSHKMSNCACREIDRS